MNGFDKRQQQKKQQILQAAFDLMNTDRGIKNIKIEDIVEQANVSKTSIFNYFGNKENVIQEVFKQFINQMTAEATAIINRDNSFEETFIALSLNKARLLQKINRQLYLDMMAYMVSKQGSDISILMNEYTHITSNMIIDLFARGRKEGKIDLKYSDEFLLLYIQSFVEGVSNPKIYEQVLPYISEWTEVFLKGFAPVNK